MHVQWIGGKTNPNERNILEFDATTPRLWRTSSSLTTRPSSTLSVPSPPRASAPLPTTSSTPPVYFDSYAPWATSCCPPSLALTITAALATTTSPTSPRGEPSRSTPPPLARPLLFHVFVVVKWCSTVSVYAENCDKKRVTMSWWCLHVQLHIQYPPDHRSPSFVVYTSLHDGANMARGG